jgi:hypothetical protein
MLDDPPTQPAFVSVISAKSSITLAALCSVVAFVYSTM